MTNKEALEDIRRSDWNDGDEYRENCDQQVLKGLEELEHYRKVKSYIERMYNTPFYTKESGYIRKWIKGDDYYTIDYDIINGYVDIYEYEEELSVSVDELETKIIFPNDEIEKEYQEQEAEKMRKYEERRKNEPVWYSGAVFNGTYGGK